MNNSVTMAIASALVDRSLIAFMFNFRGVGGSQGTFGGGIDEQDDIAAAISWLTSQPEVDIDKIGLAGYSFGAIVVLPVACNNERVKTMALISLPMEQSQASQLKDCTMPKLLISGSKDFLVSPQNAERIYQEAAEPKQFEIVSGADHFWWGHDAAMAEKVAAFFSNLFT